MDIKRAVTELRGEHSGFSVDGLTPLAFATEVPPIEAVIAEAERFPDQIEACMFWLATCQRVKPYRTTHDTYQYKHEVEAVIGRWVSHTSFLVAVQLSGLRMIPNPDRPYAGLLQLGLRRPGAIL